MNDVLPEPPSVDARQAGAMARRIVEHHLGSKPKRTAEIGGGLTNFVFEINHADGDFVVRLSPLPGKIKDYLKEQWAMARAAEMGVPVPEVMEVGPTWSPSPTWCRARSGGRKPPTTPERFAVLREMGRLTALIHTVQTSGFGHTFDWSSNQLSRKESWAEYLRRELKIEERLKILDANGMLSEGQAKGLRAVLREIEGWDGAPVLNHGDKRLKNVMVEGEDGRITAVIDWEFSSSNAPHWDLSLALHDLSIDAKQVFLGGYGLSEADIRAMAPVLKALNVTNYAPCIERAAAEGDERRLDQFRTRFSGALDLYSL